MGLELPPELHWLEWVVGSDWPEGDEDALWRMKDAWISAANDLRSLLADGNSAYYRVLGGVGGSLADDFTTYWQQYSDGDNAYLTELAKLCEGLANLCDQTALQIEYAKYQFIIALIILAAQIAYMLAMAAPSFGASTAGIPVAEVATQSFIRVIAQNVIRTMIMMVVQNVLTDVVIQMVQIGEGHRTSFDMSKTVSTAIDGAISGAVFGAAGGAVHIGAGKLAPELSKTLLGKLGEGAAINVAGSLGLAAVTGQDLSFDNLAKTATAGMALSWGGEHGNAHPDSEPTRLETPMETDLPGGGLREHTAPIGGDEPQHAATEEPFRTEAAGDSGAHIGDEPASRPAAEPAMPSAEHIRSVLGGEPAVRPEPTHESAPVTEATHGQPHESPERTTLTQPSYGDPSVHAEPAYREPVSAEPAHRDPVSVEPAHRGPVVSAEPVHGEPVAPAESAHHDPATHPEQVYREPVSAEPAHHEPVVSAEPVHDAVVTGASADHADAPQATGLASGHSAATPAGTEPAIAPGEPAQAAGAATTSGPASVSGGFATPGAGALGHESSGTGVPGRSAAAPSIPVQRAEPRFGYEPGHAVEPPATTPRDEPGSAAEQPAGEPPAGLAHEEEFADRGLHSDDVAWSGEGRTLNSTENLAADRFLEHAYAAEEKITPRMRELATDAGGRLYGEEFARKSEESFKRKLSDEIYNEHPGEPLDRQLANMKDAVRYTVGFEDGHYTEGARRVVDGLLNARDEHGQPRYEPVKFKNSWGNDEGYVGINSFWRDNATGQVFELQIHSESSFAAKMETHGAYEVARTTDDRDLKGQMEAEANARFAEVPRPAGAAGIRIPDEAWPGGRPPEQSAPIGRPSGEQPTSGTPPGMHDRGARPSGGEHTTLGEHTTPDEHEHRDEHEHEHRDEHDAQDGPAEESPDDSTALSPYVSDAEAMQIVRDHLHSTPAGYAFYPDGDPMLRFAEAVEPRADVVSLDLHGSPDGFHIDGRVLTGEQFARAVETMRAEGRIQLGEHQEIRLAACDIARGEGSPAAQFARESGRPVTAPTERLWTNMRGEERVSSAVLREGRWVPAEPENGHWRTFGPDGAERMTPTRSAEPGALPGGEERTNPTRPVAPEAAPGGEALRARSGGDPRERTELAGADPRRLDELASQAATPALPEGARAQAKAEAYALADRLGLVGDEPGVAERRAALGEQLPEQARRFLERPDLTNADLARVERIEARSEFERAGGRVEDAVRQAGSLNELYESGIRPHEIARSADPETLRRLFDRLSDDDARHLADVLHDPKIANALQESWGSPPYEPPILAESVLHKLAEHPDLVKMMADVPELRSALADRPLTLDHLATHQGAIDTLHQVVDEIHERGAEAVAAEPGAPDPTPLLQWQRDLGESIDPPSNEDTQSGFDQARREDAAYRTEYLDKLYVDARRAQETLTTMSQHIAAETSGEAGWRPEPKDRRRAEDKIAKYDHDASQLNDLAAAKIAYDNLAGLYQALEKVKNYPGVEIVAFQDRFAQPQSSGYRDIQMSVRTANGHVGEFRLHLKSLDEVAHWEHSLYEVRRDLKAIEKTRPLTVTERAIRSGLLRAEQSMFWDALQPALPGEGR